MEYEKELISKLPSKDVIDPTCFDVTISAILIGLGAEKYIDIFRENNIGQCTLVELSDEDLIKLGVDDAVIRSKIIEDVKNLPIYQEISHLPSANLSITEIIDMLDETSQHLHRIYLSMLSNTLALKKKKVEDCLIYNDKFASDIALGTLSSMTNILNSMDIAMHTQMKVLANNLRYKKIKKIMVGSFGGALIGFLAVLFMRSLKAL